MSKYFIWDSLTGSVDYIDRDDAVFVAGVYGYAIHEVSGKGVSIGGNKRLMRV